MPEKRTVVESPYRRVDFKAKLDVSFNPDHPYKEYDPAHPYISDELEAEIRVGKVVEL